MFIEYLIMLGVEQFVVILCCGSNISSSESWILRVLYVVLILGFCAGIWYWYGMIKYHGGHVLMNKTSLEEDKWGFY